MSISNEGHSTDVAPHPRSILINSMSMFKPFALLATRGEKLMTLLDTPQTFTVPRELSTIDEIHSMQNVSLMFEHVQ